MNTEQFEKAKFLYEKINWLEKVIQCMKHTNPGAGLGYNKWFREYNSGFSDELSTKGLRDKAFTSDDPEVILALCGMQAIRDKAIELLEKYENELKEL